MKKIAIIGHRGACAYAPENTLPGYKLAMSMGVDSIDVDVVATKDKILVAYHDLMINPDVLCSDSGEYLANSKIELLKYTKDADLERILIKNMTWQQLKQNYRVKLNYNSSYAKWFPEQKNYPATELSTLQEIVDFVDIATNKAMLLQIEIKNDFDFPNWSYAPQELAKIIYDFIMKNQLIERVKVQAFDWRILAFLTQMNPHLKTAYLARYTLKDTWQQLFANSIITKTATAMKITQLHSITVLNLVKQLGGYSYEPEDTQLTHECIRTAHKLGLKIFGWRWPDQSGSTYDIELFKTLIRWDVDGIITDNPDILRELLNSLGYPVPKQYHTTIFNI